VVNGCLPRWRRFVRAYERRVNVSETIIDVAMGGSILRRIRQLETVLEPIPKSLMLFTR
jgi:hypothetical protein